MSNASQPPGPEASAQRLARTGRQTLSDRSCDAANHALGILPAMLGSNLPDLAGRAAIDRPYVGQGE
jgi:hypothetical protein